ncbi:MAG: hypothetical protein GY797_24630 [Deltaproteobacteria bacterium]|nr:hypothetical protein [Deltaproteobacteria bacterium]
MKSPEPSQAIFQTFSPFFRRHAHLLIYLGYTDSHHRMKSNDKEPAITGFITEAINNRFRTQKNPPRWYNHYSVKDDPPIEAEGRVGGERLRLDIIIEATWKGRPEYCFEAKRLRKNGFPSSKYVGESGMGCFINGLYASRYQEAAMLGYVQSDSVEQWRNKIRGEIDKKAKELRLIPPQRNEKIIDTFPFEWTSEHRRENISHPITIFHILLKCY